MAKTPCNTTTRPPLQTTTITDVRTARPEFSEIYEHLRAELRRAQHRYASNAGKSRLPALPFLRGDHAWLDARKIVTRCPSGSLGSGRLGPFEVVPHAFLRTPYAVRLNLLLLQY